MNVEVRCFIDSFLSEIDRAHRFHTSSFDISCSIFNIQNLEPSLTGEHPAKSKIGLRQFGVVSYKRRAGRERPVKSNKETTLMHRTII